MRVRVAFLVAVLLQPFLVAGNALANHDRTECADVMVVFARGSGQDLRGREASRFRERIAEAFQGTSTRLREYEVGTEPHAGAKYPAVGRYRDLFEGEFAWGGVFGGEYRASVTSGVTELSAYLNARAEECEDELYVLGGYSQGAHVTGEALFNVSNKVLERTGYVALFGDPKLSLPEGRGFFPSACRGGASSPWRRGNTSCLTNGGVLEARDPYLPTTAPATLVTRVGSWCDREDGICNGNYADVLDNIPGPGFDSSHDRYVERGDVDSAVREAVGSLLAIRPGLGTPPNDPPTAVLRVADVFARLGEPVILDASPSFDPGGAIVRYEWDFDGDGAVDSSTTSSRVSHLYETLFEGTARVRVVSSDGGTSETVATVNITTPDQADPRPSAPTKLRVAKIEQEEFGREIEVVWTPSTATPAVDAWEVRGGGRLLAVLPGNVTSAEISGVPGTAETLRVRAVGSRGRSDDALVEIPAQALPPTDPRLLSAACPAQSVPTAGFLDVPVDGVHTLAIYCLAWHEIAVGTSVSEFATAPPVRRDQMASFLARIVQRAGVPLPATGENQFHDDDGSVHEQAIDRLVQADIIRGVSEDRFAPALPVSREQAASLLARTWLYITEEELPREGNAFSDDDGSVHEAAIDALAAAGIARGITSERFAPTSGLRRDQMASFLARFLDRGVQAGWVSPPVSVEEVE